MKQQIPFFAASIPYCFVLPCFATGCHTFGFKIAASLSLLAMTILIGFAGKRNGFQNETFEKRCGATPRGKAA